MTRPIKKFTKEHLDLCLFILMNTDDGDRLHPGHLKILENVVNGWHINPRDIKRYINAYTLSIKTQPHNLQRGPVLVLQTIAARPDWQPVEDALYAHGDFFTDALRRYIKEGDEHALKDLDPERAPFPESFLKYVSLGEPGCCLLDTTQIDDYIYSSEAVRAVQTSSALFDLIRRVGATTRLLQAITEDQAG